MNCLHFEEEETSQVGVCFENVKQSFPKLGHLVSLSLELCVGVSDCLRCWFLVSQSLWDPDMISLLLLCYQNILHPEVEVFQAD